MIQNIIGLTKDMVFWPYPGKIIAPDGASFQAVILYSAAGKNIGILRTLPSGEREVFGNELYADSEVAEAHAVEMCNAYMKSNRLKNPRFPLYVRDIRICLSALTLDLLNKVNKAGSKSGGQNVVSCRCKILECVKDTEKCAKVRIARLEAGDKRFGVSLESTISDSLYKDEYMTFELSSDELYELLAKIQQKCIEVAKRNT